MQWAKKRGYRYYDLEGIELSAARAILQGESPAEGETDSVSHFKLRLGGDVVLYPTPYEHLYDPLTRWAYTAVYPRISDWTVVRKSLNRFRVIRN
jgi:lipid II:glycine glycyltransferase (peptidoglycan interpeptide bridge formation enzyme)